ncbi:MAG: STAS domain-containing protein [Campylobacterota bacterium]|nr:STAS domain-containing protein [Campylobacterota bacterium]
MDKEFKEELQRILRERNENLIEDWLTLFNRDEIDKQHRYYDDFLGFFEECLERDLFVDTDEYNATVQFLIKLVDVIGQEEFFHFRHCHYLAYMPFPILRELEHSGNLNTENTKKILIFFESITSKIMLNILNDKKEFEKASITELEEREAPLSEILDGILMVSIVGTLDSSRILKIIDKILDRLEEGDIEHVVIDISAIFDMNSEVANQILKLNNAVTFMGVDAYLSGISKNIAKSLTHLGISLGDIQTFQKTKSAVAAILKG